MTKKQAIRWAGSAAKLARRLKISKQAVSEWDDRGPIPKLRQYQIRELQQQESS